MMQFETEGMRFTFEGKNYISSMSATELYGNGIAGSDGYNISIKLPDGRFVRVNGWMESYPPQPCEVVMIGDDGIKKYPIAKLINN